MARQRHQNPDYEKLLREAERHGWRVERGKGYFKALCPCFEKHWISVPLTPSSPRTLRNIRKAFERKLLEGQGTMKIEVSFTGRLTVEPEYHGEVFDTDAEVERVLSAMTAELLKLVEDPVVTGSLATGAVEVTMLAEGPSLDDAVSFGASALRSALHSADCYTEGWKVTPMRVEWLTSHAATVDA